MQKNLIIYFEEKTKQHLPHIAFITGLYLVNKRYNKVMKELLEEFDTSEYIWKDEIHHPNFYKDVLLRNKYRIYIVN